MTLSDFDDRQADWKKREGERTVKLIEARGRVRWSPLLGQQRG